jgi:hypothetical protein
MHFHQLLRWCHEAYEESLEKFGIAATEIFPTPGWESDASFQIRSSAGWKPQLFMRKFDSEIKQKF